MPADAIRVEGARELRASLRRAAGDVAELKDTHRRVASLVGIAARYTVPVRSGTLATSIRPGATATSAIVRAGGARVPYAGPIHFGWPARRIAAQPFITSAAQDTEPEWVALYTAGVEQVLRRIRGVT